MEFIVSPEARLLLEKKRSRTIAVEVITADHSDFDVTELHVHPVSDRVAANLINEKHYRPRQADDLTVLLPNYRLTYADTVTFGTKKVLWFTALTYTGISL